MPPKDAGAVLCPSILNDSGMDTHHLPTASATQYFMILHNLQAQGGINAYTHEVVATGPPNNVLWTCELTITLNDMQQKTFTGGAPTRNAAKDVAARRALRELGYPGA
ncbi:hypothetical protein FRC01_000718 [Tulasnella sp. 417]|nr:hypothetical protein FRC01_000718 [Tulasnella sp. 417]